jgi:RNA 2',3'-cyclic 3'-phosphodiesterase
MQPLNRCAIVVRLPQEVRQAIQEVQHNLRRRAGADAVRWTPLEDLFIPIVNLGELSPIQVHQVEQLIHDIVPLYPVMNFTIEGVGGNPTVLQPRWVYVGLQGDLSALQQLNGALETALTPFLADHESRQMRAVIPIGRLKQESEAIRSALGRAVKMAAVGAVTNVTVSEIELTRTLASTLGPVHDTIAKYALR